MAGRIFDAGQNLVVFNRRAKKAAGLRRAGAKVAESIETLAKDREVVITMLADDGAREAVTGGAGGLLAALPKGAIHMAVGTHSVAMTRSIAGACSRQVASPKRPRL